MNFEDSGYILDIQAGATYGTLIRNNTVLCIDPSIEWLRRNDSYLEYNIASV